MTPSQLTRFMAKVQVIESGCWAWFSAFHTQGYGLFWIDGSTRLAHRVSYEHYVGEIPVGLQLDHLCRNRGCVNPSHLEAITHQENVDRGEAGWRNKAKTHCPRGHEYTPENTHIYRGMRWCRACNRITKRQKLARKRVK